MFLAVVSVPMNLELRDTAVYHLYSDTASRLGNTMLNVGMMFK